ncbi:hypothetical protein BX600DRAFT_311325 [Xylariales sp. PMI_506]|nr:hypothetical protein BX600DRAFT_311325 [Xylariales sp. PMI_506]
MMPRTKPDPNGSVTSLPRFELPKLEFNFAPLTEGTDIPAPLPSPIQEVPTPPKTPKGDEEANGKANGHVHGTVNVADMSPKSDISTTTGLKRPIEDPPVSPTASTRGSLRRLLSRSILNPLHEDQVSIGPQSVSRPPSRTASTIADERKSKRGSGWFRRLRSTDSKRNSIQVPQFEEVHKGPPPPMIPELSAWDRKIDTVIGDDLFKEIK